MAAGTGSRFNNVSKAFLPINNHPIIERMVAQLEKYGLGPIFIVVGHEAERFLALRGVVLIPNVDFRSGDNAQGLKVALDTIGYEDTLILDADLVLTEGALQPLLDSYHHYKESVSLADLSFSDEEAMKLVIKDGRIIEYSKEHGKGAEVCTLVTANVLRDIYPDLPRLKWWGVGVGKGKLCPRVAVLDDSARWIEIDTPQDYEKAKVLFTEPSHAP